MKVFLVGLAMLTSISSFASSLCEVKVFKRHGDRYVLQSEQAIYSKDNYGERNQIVLTQIGKEKTALSLGYYLAPDVSNESFSLAFLFKSIIQIKKFLNSLSLMTRRIVTFLKSILEE
jgi:hypothetical protein